MAIDKSLLNIFWRMADANPRKFKTASRLCNILNMSIKEEEFKSINASIMDDEYATKNIKIELDKYNIEVIILDDRYFVVKRFDENEYQFIKQYMYENNYLLEESFSLDVDEEAFINITECYPSSYLVLENDEKMIMRSHTWDSYIDYDAKTIFGMKDFINEVRVKDNYDFKEVVNFLDKESLYYLSIRKNPIVGLFAGGATLNVPKYDLNFDDSEKEESMLLRSLGMTRDRKLKYPKIYIFGNYKDEEVIHRYEIDLLKDDKFIYVRLVDDKKDSKLYKIRITNIGSINIEELRFIRNFMIDILKDKEYKDWVVTYFDELVYRAIERKTNDLRNLSSYNSDIFDFMILEGKGIYGDDEGKTIERRAYDLYFGKERVTKWLDDIKLEPLEIGKDKTVLKK